MSEVTAHACALNYSMFCFLRILPLLTTVPTVAFALSFPPSWPTPRQHWMNEYLSVLHVHPRGKTTTHTHPSLTPCCLWNYFLFLSLPNFWKVLSTHPGSLFITSSPQAQTSTYCSQALTPTPPPEDSLVIESKNAVLFLSDLHWQHLTSLLSLGFKPFPHLLSLWWPHLGLLHGSPSSAWLINIGLLQLPVPGPLFLSSYTIFIWFQLFPWFLLPLLAKTF